jgi:hypothetical protein
MTLAYTTKPNPIAGTVETHGTITFDSSYPSGGEAIAASDVGLPFIDRMEIISRTAGFRVTYDKTNKKLLVSYSSPVAKIGTGAAAGNVTVTGIRTTDTLQSVILLCDSATVALDLTSEFAVCAADTIGNAAGTTTAGGKVLVLTRNNEVGSAVSLATLVADYKATYFENGV